MMFLLSTKTSNNFFLKTLTLIEAVNVFTLGIIQPSVEWLMSNASRFTSK